MEIITQNSNTLGIQEDINNNNSPVIENQNERPESPIQQVNPPASSTPKTESEIDEKSIVNRDGATEVGEEEDKNENSAESKNEVNSKEEKDSGKEKIPEKEEPKEHSTEPKAEVSLKEQNDFEKKEIHEKEDKKENQARTDDKTAPIKATTGYKPKIEPVNSSKRDNNSNKIEKPTVKKSEKKQQKNEAQPAPKANAQSNAAQPKLRGIFGWMNR